MTLKKASETVGDLSKPSKMPCHSFSLPAQKCKMGAKLRKVENSVCSGCYAFRGNYRFSTVKNALSKRFSKLFGKKWVAAMAFLISNKEFSGYFRWHDSGDLQNVLHLERIVEVCNLTPNTKHWLPTREYGIVSKYIENGGKIPANLIVRLSAYFIDGPSPLSIAQKFGVQSSGVSRDGFDCPAPIQENKCLQCRACWDTNRKNINYKKH